MVRPILPIDTADPVGPSLFYQSIRLAGIFGGTGIMRLARMFCRTWIFGGAGIMCLARMFCRTRVRLAGVFHLGTIAFVMACKRCRRRYCGRHGHRHACHCCCLYRTHIFLCHKALPSLSSFTHSFQIRAFARYAAFNSTRRRN